MNITILKTDALKLLKEHKEAYIKDYAETLKVWQQAVENQQQKYIDWAKTGGKGKEPNKTPPGKPENRTKDYDSYIKAIELHVEETINLDSYDQNVIIHDKLSWKERWQEEQIFYQTMANN